MFFQLTFLSEEIGPSMEIIVKSIDIHSRGKIYRVEIDGKAISVLLTFHALERIRKWQLDDRFVLETLLSPEEVLRGHHQRFIAHRRFNEHIIRVVYEYYAGIPVVITVYYPLASRYYQGGSIHEDQILS